MQSDDFSINYLGVRLKRKKEEKMGINYFINYQKSLFENKSRI